MEMNLKNIPVNQGTLFSFDLLNESIERLPDWRALSDEDVDRFKAKLADLYARFPIQQFPNEAHTENDLIWPVLAALGWTATLRQQNLSPKGREVPDGLLFENDDQKAHAVEFIDEWKRYEFGRVAVEAKRWMRPLDRGTDYSNEKGTPSTQMLRYLRRIDDITEGRMRWGILTNGAKWRLYYSGARSVSEQFLEIDIIRLLGLQIEDADQPPLSLDECRHWLKVFMLAFRPKSFTPSGADQSTFHMRAIREGRFYEERISVDLSRRVFDSVFPQLVRAIAIGAPHSSDEEIKTHSLILLYRLLFVLYAEDRDLLPVNDARYDDYSLRSRVRLDIGQRLDRGDTFSSSVCNYWSLINQLFMAIDQGDPSIGLPPYNGGLFDHGRSPQLSAINIPDSTIASIIDALSFETTDDGLRKYINYRNLSVQQLGSVYERLLEFDVVGHGSDRSVKPNVFARKTTGSYYTPDDLVLLIIKETVIPLIETCRLRFIDVLSKVSSRSNDNASNIEQLQAVDIAESILALTICDPAMGSGHFLVSLVDFLSDRIIESMAEATALVPHCVGQYSSPLADRIGDIRSRILSNAKDHDWAIKEEQLDDRHIIRRMVLKRCIYGVDKNPMAVELAKVSLWLHTFTVGAPLSFLDHHLRCGDSLFGTWVNDGIDRALQFGTPLLLSEPIKRAMESASPMKLIEQLTDSEIAEAHRSASIYSDVQESTSELDALLSLICALDWMGRLSRDEKQIVSGIFDGQFGDPIDIALGKRVVDSNHPDSALAAAILDRARSIVQSERFLHWQVAFPTIWTDWQAEGRSGGFDAVIGNPPWDRIKLQQVEWFAQRCPDIARAPLAADRRRQIAQLERDGHPLVDDYRSAAQRARACAQMAKRCGSFPLLSSGDTNIYSLFVERSTSLVNMVRGMSGLLVPSGIATDKTASSFFRNVATSGRLVTLLDFQNKRRNSSDGLFFSDVLSTMKFCAFIISASPTALDTRCAFYLADIAETADPDRCFTLSAQDFQQVNPNTGTACFFRSATDARIVTDIYSRFPILSNHSVPDHKLEWPIRYTAMFHITNDSNLFQTMHQLSKSHKAYPVTPNVYESAGGRWLPLYVGRMINQYDHRFASAGLNDENLHNTTISQVVSSEQKRDPTFLPIPQYWIPDSRVTLAPSIEWMIAFRSIARATDARTIIAAIVPRFGFGNSLSLLVPHDHLAFIQSGTLILANLNSLILDYVARAKVQGPNINWYIVEQLPIIPLQRYKDVQFGGRCADELIHSLALELTYTSIDLIPFARDVGYICPDGSVKPPFEWNAQRRFDIQAKLDAIFFILYGITTREDIRHVYSTFPKVTPEGDGSSSAVDRCLIHLNALESGDPNFEFLHSH